MKKDFTSVILVLVLIVGLSVMLYPTVADFWNQKTQSKVIVDYEKALEDVGQEDMQRYLDEADKYNEMLKSSYDPFYFDYQTDDYSNLLNVMGNGVMGYLTIDKINVELPIYHGTDSSVLNFAVGHLEGTSLPVGGKGTHAVLSAHRGLPSAKLFTNLDKLKEGDTFVINVLDRTITYEVDQIRIVLPEEVKDLAIVDGEDYCTLLTCTPYGINTHRLLVRGKRVENEKDKLFVTSQAYQIDSLLAAPVVATPMLIVLLIALLVKYSKKNSKKRKAKKDLLNYYLEK